MGNYAWTPVAIRVFAFSVLPVLLAALHVRLDTSAKDHPWKVEVYLIYLFMLGVGASGLSGFFGHVFTPDAVAESIGWPKGSPFSRRWVSPTSHSVSWVSSQRRGGTAFERRR